MKNLPNWIDGELYCHGKTLCQIQSMIRRGNTEIKFYCFDVIKDDEFDKEFSLRYANDVLKVEDAFPRLAISVYHKIVNNKKEVECILKKF